MSTLPQPTVFENALNRLAQSTSDVLPGGTDLGDYRIVKLLGAGGMGLVYLADQLQPVRRQVAIKLLKHELHGSLGLAYFNVERQAIAQMQHPAIAQVFDAGTTASGNPFFVMEYVDGEPITEAADRASLATAARLEIFVKLCMGVHHAHQKGVVHRDIKPSNVLVAAVDQALSPKLIDFGVALAIGSSNAPLSSSARDRVGTAAYMSPEQAGLNALDVDIRSDVYSLGVLLADLLSPRLQASPSKAAPPTLNPANAPTEMSAEPKPGRPQLAPHDPELQAIIKKACQVDRELRYASAAALADDVRRFLAFERVLAWPDSRMYRLRKLIRRNRLAIAAAGIALLGVLGGGISTWISLTDAREQRAVAVAAAERATIEAAKSQKTAEFLTNVFDSVRPRRAGLLDKTLLRLTLDEGVKRAASELKDQPEVLASIQFSLGQAYSALGDFKTAQPLLRAAEVGFTQTRGANSPLTFEVAAARIKSLADAGEFKEAQAQGHKIYKDAVAALGERSPSALDVLHSIAYAQWQGGDPQKAEKSLKEALRLRETFQKADDPAILAIRSNLGAVYGGLGRFDDAVAQVTEVIDRAGANPKLNPEEYLGDLIVRASLNQMRGQPDAVIADLEPNLAAIRQVHGDLHPTTNAALANLASALAQNGRMAEAAPLYAESLAIGRQLYTGNNIRLAYSLHNFGSFERRSGRLSEALKYEFEALAMADAVGSKDGVFKGEIHSGIAAAQSGLKQTELAKRNRLLALDYFTKALGADHPRSKEERLKL